MSLCPACRGPLQQETDRCPHCGHLLALNPLAGSVVPDTAAAKTTAARLPAARRRGLSRRKMIGLAGLSVAGAGLVGLGIPVLVQWLTSPPTLAVYPGDDNYVQFVAWSPDGKRLAFGGFDGIVHLWDTATNQHLGAYSFPEQDSAITLTGEIAWSPDGKLIASIASKTVRVWQAG